MAAKLTTMDNVKITFSEPKDDIINDIKYKRINIKTKYSDSTIGLLIIPLKGCYSFGLQKNEKYGDYFMLTMSLQRYSKIHLTSVKSIWLRNKFLIVCSM